MASKSEKKKDRVERGTQDDLQILKQVICENRMLFNKVLEVIRTQHAAAKTTLLDKAAVRYGDKASKIAK